jgi:hypothetical protein
MAPGNGHDFQNGWAKNPDKRALYKFVGGVKPKQVPVFRSRKINYDDREGERGMLLRDSRRTERPDHSEAKLVDLVLLSGGRLLNTVETTVRVKTGNSVIGSPLSRATTSLLV